MVVNYFDGLGYDGYRVLHAMKGVYIYTHFNHINGVFMAECALNLFYAKYIKLYNIDFFLRAIIVE